MLRSCRSALGLVVALLVVVTCVSPVRADELWVAPTNQADLGGLGIASNVFWPVTPVGAVRFAWGVPDNLQTFQSAKVVLIPHAPGGAATLNLFVCPAESGDPVIGACVGPIAHAFTGVANQLLEVDVSAAIAPLVGTAGQTSLAVLAFTTPTTLTDHIVGLRFAYDPAAPSGVATLGANTFSGTQTAPAFVGDGAGLANVNANLLDGLDSTAFAAAVHGHDVSQVTNAARLVSGNTFTGTQTVDAGNLDLDPSTAITGTVTKNGARFLHDSGTNNTFLGRNAGNFTTGFGNNTAVGHRAFETNNTGGANTAVGSLALAQNDSGNGNMASGFVALFNNTTGSTNTASGGAALHENTSGMSNTADGHAALFENVEGDHNTASGYFALEKNTTGDHNVAVGSSAGANATTGSNNIYVGANAAGVAGESNTIYLGVQGTHTRTFIAGISGVQPGLPGSNPVFIDANGQLGTTNSSSRRFKEDIHDMSDASRRLFQLRPVTFRYTQAYGDGSKPIQFGLVAEEVAEAFPELAVRGADGTVETVHYEKLSVLLLNEVQRERRQREDLEHQVRDLLGRVLALEANTSTR